MARPAVFLDRDGTVLRERDYLTSAHEMRLLPGAGAAIRRLNEAGFAVVVITNQSGIARGLLSERDLDHMHQVLRRRLARSGAQLDGIYYCPHHPEAPLRRYRRRCGCRKPAPGLLRRAARELNLDLPRSFAIGDSPRDLEAGRRAGCRAILVRTGYGMLTETTVDHRAFDHAADDLPAAVTWMLAQRRRACRAMPALQEKQRRARVPCKRP
jgi:D-glycero-D-manno-heptose 1,7-bisphosphate phosphatase